MTFERNECTMKILPLDKLHETEGARAGERHASSIDPQLILGGITSNLNL